MPVKKTELPLNPDGSVYHLHLLPQDIGSIVFLVGDPARVACISRYFDQIDVIKHNREYLTHTGYYKGQRISVISTGIGAAGIEIVLMELDILVNQAVIVNEESQPAALTLIRLGTCGANAADIACDSRVISAYAIGSDASHHYYDLKQPTGLQALISPIGEMLPGLKNNIYPTQADQSLLKQLEGLGHVGITWSAPFFYGAQQRSLRMPIKYPTLLSVLDQITYDEYCVLNIEMETATIYALGSLLGYACCSISTVVFNRQTQETTKDSEAAIDAMIQETLQAIA